MYNFFRYNRYLLVFAHPDEEIYVCATMQQIMRKGKNLRILYVTSGDYSGPQMQPIREKEIHEALNHIGVDKDSVQFLRIPEKTLLDKLASVRERIKETIAELRPECVITHDFEGGHNGHDAVSYAATAAAGSLPVYTFPAYHGQPEQRAYNRFIQNHPATETFTLNDSQKKLKKAVMEAHASQKRFMTEIIKSDSSEQFFDREKLRKLEKPYDYTMPPTDPIGYEFPSSTLRFADFVSAVKKAEALS